jgi:hypothetical protein
MDTCRFISIFQLYYLAWQSQGPGRISSTAADLFKWDKALYTEKLDKQSTLQDAFTPMKLNNGTVSNYGFGWELRNGSSFGKIVQHNGDNPGIKRRS